jgi:hypothetical protein
MKRQRSLFLILFIVSTLINITMGDAATKSFIVKAFKDKHPPQYTSFFEISEADVTLHGGNPIQFEVKAKEFNGGFVGNVFKGVAAFKGSVDSGLTTAEFHRV